MRLIDTNYCTDSVTTVTASSQKVNFPASNMKNPFRSKRWRSANADTAQWVRYDIGTTEEINSVVVLWPREDGVKLSNTASISIQANATDDWTAPAVNQVLTLDNDYSVASHFFATSQSYRYWRLVVTDIGNPNGYIEVGLCVLGQSLTLEEPENGFTWSSEDMSKVTSNDYGHQYVDEYPMLQSVEINFAYMLYADVQRFADSYRQNGTRHPVLLVMDADETVYDKDHFLIYGKYDKSMELEHVMYNLFDASISITELG